MENRGDTQLVHFDAARQALTLASSIDEVKQIRDKAEALRQYIRQQGASLEMQNQAAEIKIRAEIRAGEMLGEQVKVGNPQLSHDAIIAPKLSELGISFSQSSRWQLEASVPEVELEQYFAKTRKRAAEGEKWGEITSAGVLRLAFALQRKESVKTPDLPEGMFRVVYADPPWQYDNTGFEQSVELQYPTMPIEEIYNVDVPSKIGDEAVLFLWVTNAFLTEGLRVCKEWGFDYKTNLAWIKRKGPSIGWFSKSRHELLFIATKGVGMHPKEKPLSWFEGESSRHSQKPESVYGLIESMYSGPYLELFARWPNKRKDWTYWGDESDHDSQNPEG